MLITRVKPTHLWGKKVYDDNGRCIGQVVEVASRRGVARKVVVQRARRLLVPTEQPTLQPRLWVVR
jgi:sporulation protein YlmC with PRC-barrel domain